MNNRNLLTILIAAIILITSSTFIVDEREVAIKFRLGEIVRSYEVSWALLHDTIYQ